MTSLKRYTEEKIINIEKNKKALSGKIQVNCERAVMSTLVIEI